MKLFKEFLDYVGGVRLGSHGNYKPMASLGDRGPKGQAGQNSRGVGLNATFSTRAAGSMRPFLKAQTGAYNVVRDGMVIYKTNNSELALRIIAKARIDEPKSNFKMTKNTSLKVGEKIAEEKTPLEKYLDSKTIEKMVEGGFKDFEEDGGNNARI